jgi:hypothetical protein
MRRIPPRPLLPVAALLIAVVASVAACDASTKSSASHMTAPGAKADVGGQGEVVAGAVSAAPSGAAAPSGSASAGGPGTPPVLANRFVVVTADITVRANDIKKAVSAVQQLAGDHDGVVYAEQVDLTPKDPQNPGAAQATITLKVPPDQLSATLDGISAVGTEVGRSENSDDVTAKVVDVNARIDAAKASITRLQTLLDHTGGVADLLTVENQLSQRVADLESLEQQQKALTAQTSQATITVHLLAMPPVLKTATTKRTHVPGFLRGLRGGWHAFTKTVSAFATAFGALLPFLVVVAVLAVAFLLGRRRLRARGHDDESAQPTRPAES